MLSGEKKRSCFHFRRAPSKDIQTDFDSDISRSLTFHCDYREFTGLSVKFSIVQINLSRKENYIILMLLTEHSHLDST
jgi:hypothetical protein